MYQLVDQFGILYQIRDDYQNLNSDEVYMPEEHKHLVLEELERSASMEYTRIVLRKLEKEIDTSVEALEALTGCKNWILRLLLFKISL
jgi:hypothetical protein